jgi:hypothetical protein
VDLSALRALHVRHAHAYTQERLAVLVPVPVARRVMASSNTNAGGSRLGMNTLRLSCAEHRQSCHCITAHKTSVIHDDDDYTDNYSCICVCNYGIPAIRSSCVARHALKGYRPGRVAGLVSMIKGRGFGQ